MPVVFLVQDSLPNGRVGADLTPNLWQLIVDGGGWSAEGGRSVLASSTYPNHASFVTGVEPVGHRIFTNDVWSDEHDDFVCSSTVGPACETIFDAARSSGVTTAAVLGDQTMVGSMGAAAADVHWPPSGRLPAGTATDSLGYAANSAVLDALDSLDALMVDLAYVHFNEPDSALHLFGPDAPETLAQIRANDDDLASLVERLRPRWDDTVLLVVSDHEQEAVDHDLEPVVLQAELDAAGLPGRALDEGMIGLVVNGSGAADLMRLPPIEGAIDLEPGVALAWAEPGRVFGASSSRLAGQHGSPRTATQVAVVAGGHEIVPELAASLGGRRPYATDWAPTVAALVGIELSHAAGVGLIRTHAGDAVR